ncbi:protein translocase subunit SecD [Gammaproteobacteria bacterium]|nr:protein translocase subunit SecD [Gammaproteobacteria bacterium]
MADNGVFGQNLFGNRNNTKNPHHYSVWRYFVALFVLVLACIYAAPNLYPPDYALQIQADNSDLRIGASFMAGAATILADEGIRVKASNATGKGGLIRLGSDLDQLRAQSILDERLNPPGRDRQFVIALNLAQTTPAWLQDLGAQPMTLGLDLSGGIHFVLEVDMESAIAKALADEAEKATNYLRQENIRYRASGNMVQGNLVRIPFATETTRDEALRRMRSTNEYDSIVASESQGSPAIEIGISDDMLATIEDVAIEQNLTGLRSRINELGVAEPLVQRLGRSRIVIDLPGVQDSSEAKRLLDKFATLEFRLVAKPDDRPSSLEVMPYEGRDRRLQRANIVTGDSVINANQGLDPETGLPQVNIELDSDGGERMNRATGPNIGHSMAIIFIEQKPVIAREVINGEMVEKRSIREERRLISVATIQAALGYRFRITGLSMSEARDLALLLRAGALAAPMYIVEERTVGASLGEENIERGVRAVVIGFVLVLLFMLLYYKVFGLVANIALAMNLTVLVAVMSLLGATLTLPGIAGIVLTVGMAVDANVLIFSRIREELAQSAPSIAIQAGYGRAFLTILDANITTLLVALILLSIGSGPVAGFAVTLSIGILTSMFTAIFVSRGIVHLVYGRRQVQQVWI